MKLTGETVFTTAPSVTGVIDYGQYNDNLARWVPPTTITTATGCIRPDAELLPEGRVRIGDMTYRWHDGVFMWVVEMEDE